MKSDQEKERSWAPVRTHPCLKQALVATSSLQQICSDPPPFLDTTFGLFHGIILAGAGIHAAVVVRHQQAQSCCLSGPTKEGHLFQAETPVMRIKIMSFTILLELDKNMALTRYADQMTRNKL